MKHNQNTSAWRMSVAALQAAEIVAKMRQLAPEGFDPQATATTISGYSDQLNQGPPGQPQLYVPIKSNLKYGRVRCDAFTMTFASQASGTSFALAKLPRGARILSGILAASATLANSATLAVGLAGASGTLGQIDDATAQADSSVNGAPLDTTGASVTFGTPINDGTALLKAAAAQGATQVPFAITRALGYLYETQKEVYLTITTGTGTVATEVLFGHVLYVVD